MNSKAVEITDDDQVNLGVRFLQSLHLVGDGHRLLVALLPDAFSVHRVLNPTQRAVVDGHHRDREGAEFELEATLDQQRRPIVEDVHPLIHRVEVRFEVAQLLEPVNAHRLPHHEADIDGADVVALHQDRCVDDRRIQYCDFNRQILEHPELFHLLNGQDIGSVEDAQNEVGQLGLSSLVLGRRHHEVVTHSALGVLTRRVIDIVEEPEHVETAHCELASPTLPDGPWDLRRHVGELVGPQLIAAELVSPDAPRALNAEPAGMI